MCWLYTVGDFDFTYLQFTYKAENNKISNVKLTWRVVSLLAFTTLQTANYALHIRHIIMCIILIVDFADRIDAIML